LGRPMRRQAVLSSDAAKRTPATVSSGSRRVGGPIANASGSNWREPAGQRGELPSLELPFNTTQIAIACSRASYSQRCDWVERSKLMVGRYAVEIQAIGCIDASLFHGHVAGVVGACIRLFVVRKLACLRRIGVSAVSAAMASGTNRLEYPEESDETIAPAAAQG
jgi:hypothetical protein